MAVTITEGLAELKTIEARLAKKREFALSLLVRQEYFKDPHASVPGGSREVLARERDSIRDLEDRVVEIRSAIQGANRSNEIKVGKESRTIHDWLVWRRDVAPNQKEFLNKMRATVEKLRQQAVSKGFSPVPSSEAAQKPQDLIINVDELQLAQEIESIEEILGILDGQLSLKNATLTIDV